MIVVTATGYIVSVLGPYLADSKNNDASILRHMIYHNAEELRNWLQEEDVFVVDRGFRDAQDVLEDVRWVVEACNGRLKQWQYLSKTLPNSQIPFIGDYVIIVAALCNKYRPSISRSSEEDEQAAVKMLHLSQRANTLQECVEGEGLDRRGMRWSKVDVENVAPDFPCYDESELRQLTLGVYQLRMALSYAQEHTDAEG
uniref:DDE Tnp4 domain-containing protein n=1 Tax=Magallana gigas TaxID=29159 RepID=K1P127_MAGGI